LLKIRLGFAGKADDHVGRDAYFPLGRLHPGDTFHVLLPGVEALHRVQHAVRSAAGGSPRAASQPAARRNGRAVFHFRYSSCRRTSSSSARPAETGQLVILVLAD
jgi:hypothetical protein